MSAAKKGRERNDDRPNGKAWKKTVKVYDPATRRLAKSKHPKARS